MRIQSIVMPDTVCSERQLFFRNKGDVLVSDNHFVLAPQASMTTDTYMNVFDAATWEHYTGVRKWLLKLKLTGKGTVKLYSREGNKKFLLCEKSFQITGREEIIFSFQCQKEQELIYFKIDAQTEVKIWDAFFEEKEPHEAKNLHFAVIICTYKRKCEIYRNIECLKKSRFFDKSDELYGKMNVYIIDNASELQMQPESFISVYYNQNTGGSGGFSRGIEEVRREENDYGITHVVLMDDDVEFLPETFYRLYALLAMAKTKYCKEVIAGRMFRREQRQIQYTAAEIWNNGKTRHIGWNMDMNNESSLLDVNKNEGAEYSGWWFACYPMDFVRKETPLPFFLHCDDVEYGLRHGGTPIILNGIQVWHEVFEYRQTPQMAYYDARNSLIVNKLRNKPNGRMILALLSKCCYFYENKQYQSGYMTIEGMKDYCRGMKWFYQNDLLQNDIRIKDRKFNFWEQRVMNLLFRLMTTLKHIAKRKKQVE